MEWLIFIVVLFVGFDTNRSAFAPNESYFYGVDGEPIACKPLTDLENNQKGHVQSGKIAGYSNSGESICRRDIFEAKDRDHYFNLIAAAASERSNTITSKLAVVVKDDTDDVPIYIDTSSIKDYQIARYLYHVFAETIVSSQMKRTIIRYQSDTIAYRILKIEIAPTVHKEEIILAKLTAPIKKSEQISKWMVL